MFNFRTMLMLIAVFQLAACGPAPIKMKDGAKAGDYRIVEFQVESSQGIKDGEARGNVQDVSNFEQALRPVLSAALAGHTAGRPVVMTIRVDQIRLRLSDALSAVIGDAIQVWTNVTLTDAETKQEVGSFYHVTMSKSRVALIGVIADSMSSDTPESMKQKLVEQYSKELSARLYPKK